MAVRVTKTGLQSYDPMGSFKKKKKTDLEPTASPLTTEKTSHPDRNPISPESRMREGDDYIRAREKLAATQGISSKQAAEKMVSGEQAKQDEKMAETSEAAMQAEIAGIPQPGEVPGQLPGQVPGLQERPTYQPGSLMQKAADIASFGRTEGTPQVQVSQIPVIAIETLAELIDGIASVLLSKQSARVTTAKQTLTEAIQLINQDIKNVGEGQKEYIDAKLGFGLAEAAVFRLERTNTGLGKVNLRYWLGGGKATEATIIQTRSLLNDLRIDLENARITAATNKIKKSYGVEQ